MLLSLLKSAFGRREKAPARPEDLDACGDEELMLRYAAGEGRAFELLYNRHERGIYHYALRSCGQPEVANELMQEVFLRVVRYAAKYKPEAKFSTWLYTIARNLCIDRARKTRRVSERSLQETLGSEGEGGTTRQDMLVDEAASSSLMSHERAQFMQALHQALDTLPEEQREVFLLKEVSGLKFREIAEVVGAPVPTVKSRMRYALEALRGHMSLYKDHHFDEEERVEVALPGGGYGG